MKNKSPEFLLTRLENKINKNRPDVEVIINDDLRSYDPVEQRGLGTAALYINLDFLGVDGEDDPALEEQAMNYAKRILRDKLFHTRTAEFTEEMHYVGPDNRGSVIVDVKFLLDGKGRFWRNR